MYNGIGLQTARGSGTNGYVQKNLSLLNVNKNHKSYEEVDREAALYEQRLTRAPNKALLAHEKKRKIEIKCIELADLMLEQGYDEEEIKRKVASYREILKEKDPTMNKVGKSDYDSGKTKAESSHEIAKLNADQQEKLKNAFGISKDYKPGQAFANKLGSDIMKDKGPDGNGKSGFKAPRMPGNKRAPEGIPGHMVNQVPDQKEQFRSKYDELDSESSSSDSSDSDSSDSSDSEDDHKKEGDGDSSSTDEEEERRKEKKRKRRRREKEKAKQRELLRKSRKRQQKEENEIKEEAASLRASRAASEAPSNYSNMPTGGGGYINPDYVPPEQQYESPHWPIHKRRKERGESQVRNDNYYRESRDRYNGNRGHENYPKYDEFARQSRNREYRGSQVRGQGYDDRAQYREMYQNGPSQDHYDKHADRLTNLQNTRRQEQQERRNQANYDRRDDRGDRGYDRGYDRGENDGYY